jgi:polyribonucleotide nucleotidyltransferase
MANKVIRLTESDLERIIKRVIAEQEMEEGLFGASKEEKENTKNELMKQMEELVQEEGLTENDLFNSFHGILKKAEDSNYKGRVVLRYVERDGEEVPFLRFVPELSMLQKFASGTRAQSYGR